MSSKNLVYVLNGANINMLEFRSPVHYHGTAHTAHTAHTGHTSYNHLCETLVREGDALGLHVALWQSNSESAMVDKIQSIAMEHIYPHSLSSATATATSNVATATPTPTATSNVGVIINAGGYTHTSVVIRDALELLAPPNGAPPIPIVEVHMSNIFAREGFRHHSYISGISRGVIAGLGVYSYVAALHYIANFYATPTKQIQK